jgi:molybdopterin-guanine dinucleotide biosynthesis protein A
VGRGSETRPASAIVKIAFAIGVLVILAGGTARRMRNLREERRCFAGDLQACIDRCASRRRSCCEELVRRCTAGESRACEAREFAAAQRRRLPF